MLPLVRSSAPTGKMKGSAAIEKQKRVNGSIIQRQRNISDYSGTSPS
jgi:hypothetical protein